MNVATIIILLLLCVAVWFALKKMRNHKCGSCEGCTCECSKRSK